MTTEPFTNTYIQVHTYRGGIVGVMWKERRPGVDIEDDDDKVIFWHGHSTMGRATEKAERFQASLIERPEIIYTRWDGAERTSESDK